jgi:hypothetical protein
LELSLIFGYALAIVVGLLLGLLGGGGSILALPIFVYLFGTNPILATTYSLFVIGVSSLFGTYKCVKSNSINYNALIYFGFSSVISVLLTRMYLIDLIPESIFLFDLELSKGKVVLIFFSLIMLGAGYSMIFVDNQKIDDTKNEIENCETNDKVIGNSKIKNIFSLSFQGLIDGAITGIVGAGGGFLIVPALVFISKLDIRIAISTSLAIISLKTIIGFLGSLNKSPNIDYIFLSVFTFLAILGMVIGIKLSKKINPDALKKYFGVFVILCAIYILLKELY